MFKNTQKPSLAETSDKHQLYELAVQCAEAEVDFLDETYHSIRDKKAQLLREDFCGTASVCCEWVSRDNNKNAIGIDLEKEVLTWGKDNNLTKITGDASSRIHLINDDVLTVNTDKADIIAAMNFSYWLFKDRELLIDYFKSVYQGLKDDGIFFMDAFGGYEAFQEIEEEREIDDDLDFTYTWDQASFNPIDNNILCHIHFDFSDGSRMEKAFTYDWRLWTLPEIKDVLLAAGFKKTTIYWQGWDDEGEGNGAFYPTNTADADAGWICYIAAEK